MVAQSGRTVATNQTLTMADQVPRNRQGLREPRNLHLLNPETRASDWPTIPVALDFVPF
jgi:hypothetical protein